MMMNTLLKSRRGRCLCLWNVKNTLQLQLGTLWSAWKCWYARFHLSLQWFKFFTCLSRFFVHILEPERQLEYFITFFWDFGEEIIISWCRYVISFTLIDYLNLCSAATALAVKNQLNTNLPQIFDGHRIKEGLALRKTHVWEKMWNSQTRSG